MHAGHIGCGLDAGIRLSATAYRLYIVHTLHTRRAHRLRPGAGIRISAYSTLVNMNRAGQLGAEKQ